MSYYIAGCYKSGCVMLEIQGSYSVDTSNNVSATMFVLAG